MGWDRSDTEGNLGSASAAFGLASMLVGERIPTYLAGIPWPQGQECRRLTLLAHADRISDPGGTQAGRRTLRSPPSFDGREWA